MSSHRSTTPHRIPRGLDAPPEQNRAPAEAASVEEGWSRELRKRMDEEERAYEQQVRILMRRQRRLSLAAATVLFGIVGGFTVATFVARDFMATPIWHGFSPAMLFAAVLVYPLTWVIALLYTVRANRLDRVE